jgi:tetratricopeptide (TPR) repeat protein
LNSGKLDDAKGYSEKTLELAQLLKDSHGAAHAFIGLADVYYEMGEYEQARQYLNDAQTLTGDSLLIVKIYKLLGNIASIYGESAKALEYYQQTLEISRQSGNKLGVAHSLNNLGVEAYLAGDYRRAAAYYHESRLLCMELGDLNNVALALNNLGNIAGYIEGEDALNYYQEALAIFSRMGRRWGEALVHGNIGRTLELSGDPRAACPHYETSVAICEEIGDKYGLCDALCNLAFAHIIEGDSDAARKELHQGLQLAQELEVDNALHHAILGYARLFIADSRLQEAAELLGMIKVQLGDDIDIETRVRLDPVVVLLEGALPIEELTAIFEQSKSLNLDAIIGRLLNADEQVGSTDD